MSSTSQQVRHRLSKHVRTLSSTPFKQWPKKMIECDGDYRKQSHLEDYIGGPLYAHQSTLPRLPVPTLEDTIERFLPSALPLAKSNEEKISLKLACDRFPVEASKLQQRLVQRRNSEMADSSWLQSWWNQLGYLRVRDTAVINVSYFFQFSDDPTAKKNVTRGASILFAIAEFRRLICSGQFPQETMSKKKTALCSAAFKYMFHACRIPQRTQDSYRIYDPSQFSHAVVARKGHFFTVELSDQRGEPVSMEDLQDSLSRVIELADNSDPAIEFGILTSNNRDSWADARKILLEVGGVAMEHALEKLESGAVLLCLDEERPVSRQQFSEILLHGGSNSSANRWFDKSIQVICTENGKAGLMGEHSMMDGMPVVALADHICNTSYTKACFRSSTMKGNNQVDNIFSSVQLNLQTHHILSHVADARRFLDDWKGKHELSVQSFQGYGSNFIKKAGFSPDAFVQIAMQLATFRLWGEQGGTYEATQTRAFLHGRTETTRAVSPENEAFVKVMGLSVSHSENEAVLDEQKIKLAKAVQAHVKYIGYAAKGLGVDRHLLGLSLLVTDDEKAPALYSDPVFARSKTWRVSTSNLTHPKLDNWGYGEVTPNGVGLSYSIHPNHCIFSITSLKEHNWAEKLSHFLEEALLEIQTLVQIQTPKSKL
mmetsp:Transcript_28548/g.31546  ORF Transcript_28548/g.31546 Transcript_28548/m.31546 type:complete len:656 (-) Transcript_28548:197-2164(-)